MWCCVLFGSLSFCLFCAFFNFCCKSSKHFCERNKEKALSLGVPACVCVSLRLFLSSPMSFQSSVASSSSSSSAAALAMEEAPPGFSREEQAALQWALKKKGEGAHQGVCVCCLPVVGG